MQIVYSQFLQYKLSTASGKIGSGHTSMYDLPTVNHTKKLRENDTKTFQRQISFLYDLPKKNYTKKLREIKNQFSIAPLSPGMQEHVAKHREKSQKSRNTCTKKYTNCILYNQKRGHIVNPNLEIQKFRNLEIQKFRNLEIQKFLNLKI